MKIKRFTTDEDRFIKDNYLELTLDQMAIKLNRALGSVAGRMRALGLKVPEHIKKQRFEKSYARLAESGKASRFKKGHTPSNKGKKMPAHVYERCKATMFKPGRLPHNTRYFGKPYLYLRKRRNGNPEKIWFIQAGRKRRSYLAYLCEQNGIDLTGRKPILKKGFDHSRPPKIEDIMVLTNKENMERNSLYRYPTELVRLIQAKGALKRQINKLSKNEKTS